MKLLKNLAAGFIALATAGVTLTTSAAVAQDMNLYERPGMDRPGRGDRDGRDRDGRDRDGRDRDGRDGRDDDRGRRSVYLGTTGLISKGRFVTREINVRSNQEFRGLEFVAQDDDFEMRRVVVYFRNGGSRNLGGARISEGGRVRADFQNYRRIDSIVIEGTSSNIFGSKAQLLVYGRM